MAPVEMLPESKIAAMIQQKVEIRFKKLEAVRFISHHDLMRAFQRAARRAELPVRLTEGFNPRPRIIFPAALELGIISLDEAAEIELTQWIPLNNLKDLLSQSLPPGLVISKIKEIAPNRKGSRPVRVLYRLHLGEAGVTLDPNEVTKLMQLPTLPFQRLQKGKKKSRQPTAVDLKPFLSAAVLDGQGDLLLEILINQMGSGKPLEYLSLLMGKSRKDLLGIKITKLQMQLQSPTRAPSKDLPKVQEDNPSQDQQTGTQKN